MANALMTEAAMADIRSKDPVWFPYRDVDIHRTNGF